MTEISVSINLPAFLIMALVCSLLAAAVVAGLSKSGGRGFLLCLGAGILAVLLTSLYPALVSFYNTIIAPLFA